MRRPGRKQATVLLVAIAIAVAVAAAGFAYWRGSGNGAATTVLANVQSITMQPGTQTAQLYPGGESNVSVVLSNPNSTFIQVGSIVLDPNASQPFAVDSNHSACQVSALSFVAQDNGGTGWRIPPHAGSTDGSLLIDMPAAMKMSVAAANACQGATFTVQLKAGL
jgi:ferric-dicitrate binding protein FerR (iron transport regulator)